MEIDQILFFCAGAILIGVSPKARQWLIFILSILVIYWLQPAMPIRNLDFWLPTCTLVITVLTWIVTRSRNSSFEKVDAISILLVLLITLTVGLNRYLEPFCCILPTRSPVWQQVLSGLSFAVLLALAVWRLSRWNRFALVSLAVLIISGFVILKTSAFSLAASTFLRGVTGQQISNATPLDIRWIGFSYIAFRLLHVLRDRLAGRLEAVSLRDLVSFSIFFPAFSAGPIDRLPRFTNELLASFRLDSHSFWLGGQRIFIGLFKKFAIADSLALIALNDINAAQTTQAGWLWILTYIYAFRIYFDFSGYTDIAIGLGLWMGFRLPENFNQPYLKSNLTQFWNSWHMTLAQWFRAYIFNPFTRWLRSRPQRLPIWSIILAGQLTTMLLIGLWHGIQMNFLIWGLWHGAGLFLHNRWSEVIISRLDWISERNLWQPGIKFIGMIATFHYVTIGWVWFAMVSPESAWQVIQHMLGIG
jgi:alginate O-acetyltransferase complex protein AlgI